MFGQPFEIEQTLLEFAADHLVPIEDRAHHFLQEGVATTHRPGDRGGRARQHERELGGIRGSHRLYEFEPHHHVHRCGGIGDGHASIPDLTGTAPGIGRTLLGLGSL